MSHFGHCLCFVWRRHKRVNAIVLYSYGLEGSLSPHVGNLSFLCRVYLWHNSFQGTIPPELGRLSRLRHLILYDNKLSGVILKEISFLSKLKILQISDNKLEGGILPSMGNITSLEVFTASRNPLGGSIPDTLGHLNSLIVFYSCDCNLYGSILPSIYNLSLFRDGDDEESDEIGYTWKVVMLGYGCGILVGLVMGNLMLSTRKVKWFNAIADATESLVLKKKKRRHVYVGK
ncbi:kinase-like domain-containing protein [Tanacetum coccineum]